MVSSGGVLVASGIWSLDRICSGGFPRGGMILLSGPSGSGKTSLAYEFLLRGTEMGEKGLLATDCVPSEKYLRQLPELSFRSGKAPGKGVTMLALDTDDFDFKKGLAIVEEIGKKLPAGGRLVWDPLPLAFSTLTAVEQQAILNRLADVIYEKKAVAVLVSEHSDGVLATLVDGIIALDGEERESDVLRTLQVVKMKGTKHSLSRHAMLLSHEGILLARLLRRGRK